MKPEDIGPILALVEHRERKERRAKIEADFNADERSFNPSPRAMRARLFASQVLGMVSRFTPEACRDDVFREVALCAYDGDWEITQVPPERDATAAAELRRMQVTLSPTMIIPK